MSNPMDDLLAGRFTEEECKRVLGGMLAVLLVASGPDQLRGALTWWNENLGELEKFAEKLQPMAPTLKQTLRAWSESVAEFARMQEQRARQGHL